MAHTYPFVFEILTRGFRDSEFICDSLMLQQGWTADSVSRMLTVKKQPVVTEQKLDPSKLQRLTEYVFHLEH